MPDALDLDSIAAQMKAAAERTIATPAEPDRRHADWRTALVPDFPILSARTDLTGARVVASNPEHILAILAEREAMKAPVSLDEVLTVSGGLGRIDLHDLLTNFLADRAHAVIAKIKKAHP